MTTPQAAIQRRFRDPDSVLRAYKLARRRITRIVDIGPIRITAGVPTISARAAEEGRGAAGSGRSRWRDPGTAAAHPAGRSGGASRQRSLPRTTTPSHRRGERGPGCRPANSPRGTSSYTWDEPSTSSLQCASCGGSPERRAKPPHGTTPQVWLNLQQTYDLRRAEIAVGPRIAECVRPRHTAA